MNFRHKYSTIRLLSIIMTVVGVICVIAPGILKAQTTLKLVAGKDVVVKVTGTSNLNNWALTSMASKSLGYFEFDTHNKLVNINMLNFSIQAKSLKSVDKTMDSRTYKALKADDFSEITFKLAGPVQQLIKTNDYKVKAKGELRIAGVTQPIILNVDVVVGTNNTVACNGTKKIKLSDYKIDPPGLMFDIFKVDDVVTVEYMVIFNK